MTRQIKDLSLGFSFIVRGVRLLFKVKGAFKWAIIPFLINLSLILISLYYVFSDITAYAQMALAFVLPGLAEGWLYSTLLSIITFSGGFVMTILVFYVSFLLSTVIASPFNSILAEKTLHHLKSKGVQPLGVIDWIRITIKQVSVSLVRALLFAIVGIVIFIFSFIPVLNIIGAFFAFLIVAFDCTDYAMEIKMMTLSQRMDYLKKHFSVFSGMALMLGLTLMVPGLTLLLLPFAVVGATETMTIIEKRRR